MRPIDALQVVDETREQRRASVALMHTVTANSVSETDKSKYIDLTDKLTEAMHANAKTLSAYREQNGWFNASAYFVSMVDTGGKWDFKSQKDWGLSENFTYKYGNKLLRYDDVGNIHYGYVGRELFEEWVLLKAAGVVQIRAQTSQWSFWNSNFDDPRDQEMIKYGSQLWDLDH